MPPRGALDCILKPTLLSETGEEIPLIKKTFIAALLALGVAAALIAGTAGARSSATVTGAGSTFAAPLFGLWAQNYKGATITYNPI